MSKKTNYQYFNNISQRINLTNDTKSHSVENLESLKNSNHDTSSGWFSSLSSRTKSRLANDKRQNSCTSSEAGSQISQISSLSNNNSNSKNDVNEKADTISNLSKSKLDVRTNENSNRKLNNSPLVALRNSNRSTSKLANGNNSQKDDSSSRKQSKDEANDQPLYYRYSSPEPEFLVPNPIIFQNYLNYLKHYNLNLNVNHLNQLNELNCLHQVEQLYQLNQLSQLNQLQTETSFPIATNLNQPSSSTTIKTADTENEQLQNQTVSTETSTTEHQPSTAFTSTNSTAANAERVNNSEKPQLVQCPQLANNSEANILDNSTQQLQQQLKKANLDSDDLNKQQFISEQVHHNQANDQFVFDEFKNLNLSKSESNQSNEENFKLVKELFDVNAHLYMSVEQMSAMEKLIRMYYFLKI